MVVLSWWAWWGGLLHESIAITRRAVERLLNHQVEMREEEKVVPDRIKKVVHHAQWSDTTER